MSEPDVTELISVDQAIAILDAVPVKPRVAEVGLEEAQGLRLAADVVADRDYPPFDKSQMDGVACRGEEVTAGNELVVVVEIPAGAWPSRAVGAGEAMRIMTGAPMPEGADTVVPVEFIESSFNACRITRAVKRGNAVALRGSDVRAGTGVLASGTVMGPAQLAVAATVGAGTLSVVDRPRVAVLTTGDEVVHWSQSPGPAQIRNSNSLLLSSLLWDRGCEVTDLGIAADRPEVLTEVLGEGLGHDALFVTGGMSMGDYDYVPAILKELGVGLRITKIKIKPGKPFVFGTVKNDAAPSGVTFVFGLPGNPVSSFVCATLLASRVIRRMCGGEPGPRMIEKRLATPLPANGLREFYQPVRVDGDVAQPLGWKGSADVFTLAKATGLLGRAENEGPLDAGATVRVIEI